MKLLARGMLVAAACFAVSHAVFGQDGARSYKDPELAFVVVGNVYSILHGRRALCESIAPDSIPEIERSVAKFSADFSQLVNLAEQSSLWDKARQSSERSNRNVLDEAAKGTREPVLDMCKDYRDFLSAGKPRLQRALARHWIRILQDRSPQPSDGAVEAVTVTHEVLLEGGKYLFPGMALTRTADGGYVIAGTYFHRPWATRVDAQGAVLWRYEFPMKEWQPGAGDAVYKAVVLLPDDSTLLCGYKPRDDSDRSSITGLMTRLDKAGRVVFNRELVPNNDPNFRINYLERCVRWGDGAAVLGTATQFTRGAQSVYWLMALDSEANVRWAKLLPNPAGHHAFDAPGEAPVILANGGLVLGLWRGHTDLIMFDLSGDMKAQRSLDGSWMVLPPIIPEDVVHLLSGSNNETTLRTLNEKLEDVDLVSSKIDLFHSIGYPRAIYVLPDRSLMVFGGNRAEGTDTATIARFNPAHSEPAQTFRFSPYWVSNWVENAEATGRPGEFATVRQVRPIPFWPFEKRTGVALAFVRMNDSRKSDGLEKPGPQPFGAR